MRIDVVLSGNDLLPFVHHAQAIENDVFCFGNHA